VKTALKSEIHGNGSNPRPLMKLVSEAEERQKRWHENVEFYCAERRHLFGDISAHAKKSCEALGVDHIRRMIYYLKWE
jgi:hypothetical protein